MNQTLNVFLYSPNIIFIIFIIFALCISAVIAPQKYMSASLSLLLLRPDERFESFISFTQLNFFLLILVILINNRKFRDFKFDRENKILIGLILFVILQSLIFYPGYFVANLKFCVINYLFFLGSVVIIDTKDGLRFLNYTLLFACFLICLEPVYYHLFSQTNSDVWSYFHGSSDRLIAWGMWSNANETSFIAILGVVNLLILVFQKKTPALYLASIILLPFFAIVIFLTASRAGLGAFLLIFLGFFLTIKSIKVKFIIFLIVIGTLLLAPYYTTSRSDKEGSSRNRMELLQDGIYLFKQEPVRGFGFMRIQNETGGMMLHNTFVQAFSELGILGGFGLIFYLWSVGRKILQTFRDNKNTQLQIYLCIISGFYIAGLFYMNFGNQLLTIFFFIYSALITITTNTINIAETE